MKKIKIQKMIEKSLISVVFLFLIITSVSAINFISPTEATNTYFNRTFIAVNVTVDNVEETQNEANITFYLFNSSTQLNATNFTSGSRGINFTGLNSNMKYWYNVTVRNSSGFSNSTETRIITLDSTNPSVSFSSDTLANNTYKNQTFIYINISISETNFRNVTFYLYNSSTKLNASLFNTSTTSINFTNLTSNMNYWYNVTVYDNVSNSNTTQTRKVTLDNTTPSISMTYSTITSYTRGDYILFTVSDGSGIDKRRWSIDAFKNNYTTFVNTDDIDTIENAFTGSGTIITVTYWANDSAGNIRTATFANLVVNPYIGNVAVKLSGSGGGVTTTLGQPLGAKPDIVRDVTNVATGNIFGIPSILVGLVVLLVGFVVVARPKTRRSKGRHR